MITVRFFAGARAAAGVAQESLPAGESLEQLLATLAAQHGAQLATVLRAASFLVDGVNCTDPTRELSAGATVDVLPPFAGG